MSGIGISDLGVTDFANQVRLAGQQRDLPPGGVTHDQLHQVAQAFERILLGMMVDSMREAVPEGGLLPEMPGHDMYQQMLDQEFVRAATEDTGQPLAPGASGTANAPAISMGLAAAFERQFAHLIRDAAPETPSPSETPESLETHTLHERRTAGS